MFCYSSVMQRLALPKKVRTSLLLSGGGFGLFASVLFSVLKVRSYSSKNLSCAQINETLDEIVRLNTSGEGRRGVARIFKHMFLNMDATEQKWFVRLILKDLHLGLGLAALLSALHPDA